MAKSGDMGAGQRSTGQRREEILAQALVLFTQYGIHNVSTRQIARAVGISQPSLYAHFASSAEIAEEICVRGFTALADTLDAALGGEGSRRDRLREAARAYIAFGLDNPDVYRIAFMQEKAFEHGPEIESPVKAAGLKAFNLMAETVTEALGPEGPTVAQSVWAALHGLVSLLIARPHFPWAEREALIETHIERALHGL